MSDRRMFSKRIISTAKFLQMPLSTQALYFHLGLNADDDGIVEAFPVLRMTNVAEDDLRILATKGYVKILNNQDLITYITNWNENNHIRADRKKPSIYKDLLLQIDVVNQVETECQPNDNQMTTKCPHRLGKDRIDKDSIVKDSLIITNSSTITDKIIYSLPCYILTSSKGVSKKTDDVYNITKKMFDSYTDTFPKLDVLQELKKMKLWLENNGLKTKKGMGRFIVGWLGRQKNFQTSSSYKDKPSFSEQLDEALNKTKEKYFNGETK